MISRRTVRVVLPVLLGVTVAGPAAAQGDGWRTIEFRTAQVTAPDVAVSPDGTWLVFSMLGKLFRLPARGGEAEQLTLGPYYDVDPAISPDGRFVAFSSDRDGSAGNIFVLNLAGSEITQLTHEPWADGPSWAPDGQSIVYVRLERAAWNPLDSMPRPPAMVRRIRLAGGEPETVSAVGEVWSVFHLKDGRLGWTVVNRDSASRRITTRIEIRDADGRVSTPRVLSGIATPVVASPVGDGLYARYVDWDPLTPPPAYLEFMPLTEAPRRRLFSVSGERSGFAVAADNASLYIGNLGNLWRIALPGGQRSAIPFRARVTLAIRDHAPPRRWTPVEPGSVAPVRTVTQPRLSPDGSRLVFRALGRLWQQPVAGRQSAERLVPDSLGAERDPAFSPDGRQLAYIRITPDRQEVRVLDLRSGTTRSVGPAADCAYEYLTWSAYGVLVAATGCQHQHRVVAIEPTAGTVRVLAATSNWEPYPQLSADGQTLYFQADFTDSNPGYHRLSLVTPARPELLFRLPAGAEDGQSVETNERWVATSIQNRPGIRLTRLSPGAVTPQQRLIANADGVEFAFTPDGSVLLYIAGNTLWREPLSGGRPERIPIRLAPRAPTPPPVLVQRVRVLDFASGGFGAETSLLIDGGRIRWIGPEQGRLLPRGTETMDAGGRFAIPGLFDMHGHGGGCGGPARIANGVTSVRNMGGRLEQQNAAADRGDFTSEAVPRCFYAGRILEGPPGRNEDRFFIHVLDEEDTSNQVRRLQAQGAQFIKLYNMVPWPLQGAAADEARRLGLPVEAHGFTLEQMVKGVILGFAGLTHWYPGPYDDATQMFAAAGTHWEPTLGIGGREVFFRDNPERFGRAGQERWRLQSDQVLRGIWADRLGTMRAAWRSRIPLLPGTDGGAAGLALQWELEFYAEAGIRPLDILRFATQMSAQTVGAEHDLGTLEVGKLADLVLLDANPLEAIRNTQTIWRVIKGGWVFDPNVLQPNRP
jgi:imidazolonepropionase-like amidohydrolase/Tol biopolymer transport system component